MTTFVHSFAGESPEKLKLETRVSGSVIGNLMPEICASKFAKELFAIHGTFGQIFLVIWSETNYPADPVVGGHTVTSIYKGDAYDAKAHAIGPCRMIRRPIEKDPRNFMLVAVLPRE
jgi:hypothetical protein